MSKDSLTLFSNLPDEIRAAEKTVAFSLPPSARGVYGLVYWERIQGRATNDRESRGQMDGGATVNALPFRTGRAYQELLEGRYGYKVLPEKLLAMEGKVIGKEKLPSGGMLTAFDSRRGLMYDCDVQPDGSYRMGGVIIRTGRNFFCRWRMLPARANV